MTAPAPATFACDRDGETPDLDSVAMDLRLIASLLAAGADVSALNLPGILGDLAEACESWHEAVSD